MVALRNRQTISVFADDVGQPSCDFFALFRCQTGEAAIGNLGRRIEQRPRRWRHAARNRDAKFETCLPG